MIAFDLSDVAPVACPACDEPASHHGDRCASCAGAADPLYPEFVDEAPTVDTIVVDVPDAYATGWLRWEHVGKRTMRDHGHEDLVCWWLDADDRVHRTALEVSESSTGREIRVLDGDQPDDETEAEMASVLVTDLMRWDLGHALYRRDRFRGVDRLDVAVDAYEQARVDSAFARIAPEITRLERDRDRRDDAVMIGGAA